MGVIKIGEKASLSQQFATFIEGFKDASGESTYLEQEIRNQPPFILDFSDLYSFNGELAFTLLSNPRQALKAFGQAVSNTDADIAKIHVRRIPQATPIRSMGSSMMGSLVMVKGIVVKASEDTSRVKVARYRCAMCGNQVDEEQVNHFLREPAEKCEECDERKWVFMPESSTYRDSQNITIQETPEQLSSGEIPRKLDIVLLDELVKICNPGDLVEVTGIVAVRQQAPNSFRLDLERIMEGNHVEVLNKQDDGVNLSQKDKDEITQLSLDPRILSRLIHSLAPSIYA